MANHGHKRDTNARRTPRAAVIAGPLAVLATAAAVGLGVAGADVRTPPPAASVSAAADAPAPAVTGPAAGEEGALDLAGEFAGSRARLSRGSGSRATEKPEPALSKVEKLLLPAATRAAIAKADTTLWTTESLNLWTAPGDKARQTGEIEAGKKVVVTGRSLDGRDEIVWGKRETRWVTSGYTAQEKPAEEPALGGSCTNGSAVPAGVSANIKKVHDAVCASFPDITTYGTFRGDGEHAQGIAVDIMVSGAEGYRVADFVRANYAALGVSYVIYSQRIWSVQRGGEGWRGMSSRGSVTANHYDHVHVTTY